MYKPGIWHNEYKTADKCGITGQKALKRPDQADNNKPCELNDQPASQRNVGYLVSPRFHFTSHHSNRAKLYVLSNRCSTSLCAKPGQNFTRIVPETCNYHTTCGCRLLVSRHMVVFSYLVKALILFPIYRIWPRIPSSSSSELYSMTSLPLPRCPWAMDTLAPRRSARSSCRERMLGSMASDLAGFPVSVSC